MSLFENPEYEWRETFVILFGEGNRPTAAEVKTALDQLGGLFVENVRMDQDGRFESLTVYAQRDFAAMDISCADGDEVAEQLPYLIEELESNSLPGEKPPTKQLASCRGRMDVFHFSKRVMGEDEDDEFLDPGGLLVVLEALGELCHGVIVDPQSGTIM